MGKHAFPPLPTRPRLVLAVYPALFLQTSLLSLSKHVIVPSLFLQIYVWMEEETLTLGYVNAGKTLFNNIVDSVHLHTELLSRLVKSISTEPRIRAFSMEGATQLEFLSRVHGYKYWTVGPSVML